MLPWVWYGWREETTLAGYVAQLRRLPPTLPLPRRLWDSGSEFKSSYLGMPARLRLWVGIQNQKTGQHGAPSEVP